MMKQINGIVSSRTPKYVSQAGWNHQPVPGSLTQIYQWIWRCLPCLWCSMYPETWGTGTLVRLWRFIWVGKVGKCTGCQLRCTMAGWWFGTWILFFHILGIIIPTDFHIFQGGWNHQLDGMRHNLCPSCEHVRPLHPHCAWETSRSGSSQGYHPVLPWPRLSATVPAAVHATGSA